MQSLSLVNALHADTVFCVGAIEFASEVGFSWIITDAALLTNGLDTAWNVVYLGTAT